MTKEQRIAFIESFKNQIETKKELLKVFKENEKAIQALISNQKDGNVALASYKSLLAPQQMQISELETLISKWENQLEKWHNPQIEMMSDDDAIKYITS